jgi:hypothetical protein
MKTFAAVALAAFLVACGGGDDGASPAPQRLSLLGSFTLTGGGITPDPVASTQAPVLSIQAEYVGMVSPDGTAPFEVPYALHRNGALYRSGRITCTYVSSSVASSRFACAGGQSLPAQPVGTHTFHLYLQPEVLHNLTGSTDDGQATLTVTP